MNDVAQTSLQVRDFAGKAVLVTGGAQGIGFGIAAAFAARGAEVAIADLRGEAAAVAAQRIAQQGGGTARAYEADLAEHTQIARLVAEVEADFGRLDVVVHNAAYFPLTAFDAITPAILQRTLAVNLSALFWLAQAATPAFIRQGGGRMLATSSVTGPRVAYPGLAHYAASKAGVNGFIRAAALELARHRITVNGVEPGMIRTPAMDNLGDDAHNRRIEQGIPLGRLGEPSDIAAAMLFLASDAASYITGQTIVVDGGATLPESTAVLG
ncbi:SDR family oxidoreductase [Paraburkholderia bryophila]|uniref:3-oxoacyl-[acyl-carrier protein] reductase n=1 Tax=Paraburkholderia bryophila TaxID=420952 RepID=A0A7Y9W676_9BURK|nr:SDR family oxidoreductase [Paraburkholderia bryophila]NYH14401.1 3-oxoacyl-[acyl-carrier protein] reductase [Paraburkholderia bryophila]